MRARLTIVGAALLLSLATAAWAQIPGGAFDRLSPGDQKIARSLYDAQRRDLGPGSRLTLDQIAAKKSSEGWGNVFKDMKSHGLVTQKNLGQVVSRNANRTETAGNAGVPGANRAHAAAVNHPGSSGRGHSDEVPRGIGRDAGPSHGAGLGGGPSAGPGGGHGRGR